MQKNHNQKALLSKTPLCEAAMIAEISGVPALRGEPLERLRVHVSLHDIASARNLADPKTGKGR
jgi:hypothetical protein